MNLASKTLAAYSWNLVGSLLGILIFLGVSWLMLPPWVWLGVVVLGYALLQAQAIDRKRVCILLVPLILLLQDPSDRTHYNIWTPYQEIEYSRTNDDHGELLEGELRVNHTGYQSVINLSDNFLPPSRAPAGRGRRKPIQSAFPFCRGLARRAGGRVWNRQRCGRCFAPPQLVCGCGGD